MKELSIIIPAYQAEKTIERCVESILDNNISKEILIVDDGSVDRTAEVCCCLSQRYSEVHYWSIKNSGPSAARKFALQYAKGRFVTFVDADDYLSPKTYERIIAYLNDDIDILEYGYDTVSETGEILSHNLMNPIIVEGKKCGLYFAKHWNTTNYLCNKLFRRNLFEHVMFPDYFSGEDYAVLAQLFVFAKGYRAVEQGFYQYVMTSESLCRKSFTKQRLDNILSGQYVERFYRCEAPELCQYAQQKLCSLAVNLYCQCMQSSLEDRVKICNQLKCIFEENKKKLGIVKVMRMGSISRRILLSVFSLSPKLCVKLYSINKIEK